jgi:hypothetical protein
MDGLIPRCRNYTELMGFDAISSYGLGGGGSSQVKVIVKTFNTRITLVRELHLLTKSNEVHSKSYSFLFFAMQQIISYVDGGILLWKVKQK